MAASGAVSLDPFPRVTSDRHVCLAKVGAPNVGKSSIVRAVSTGTPEVNSYPFTTRGMALGHMFHPETNARYQVRTQPKKRCCNIPCCYGSSSCRCLGRRKAGYDAALRGYLFVFLLFALSFPGRLALPNLPVTEWTERRRLRRRPHAR